MSRRYGRRLVDGIWIQQRMNEQDALRQLEAGTLFPAFLQPEIVPVVVEVELVPVGTTCPGPVVDVALVPKKAESSSSLVNLTNSSLLNNGGDR